VVDFIPFDRFNNNTLITLEDGTVTFGLWDPPPFLRNPDLLTADQIGSYYVNNTREGKPEAIADDIYGSTLLDWILVYFNNVLNPMGWPKAGTTIAYPSRALVAKYIT
jgi:hypothetical protein